MKRLTKKPVLKNTAADPLVERIAAQMADAISREGLNPALKRISQGFDAVIERMVQMLAAEGGVRPGELEALQRRVDHLWEQLKLQRELLGLTTPEP